MPRSFNKGGTRYTFLYFYPSKWSLGNNLLILKSAVHVQDIHENCSNFSKIYSKVPPVNSEVLVHLKSIESCLCLL